MNVPPKGTLLRAQTELTVHIVRLVRPTARWLSRQSWVIAYAEWDERHVPKWFTPMNVVYFGVAVYGLMILVAFLTTA